MNLRGKVWYPSINLTASTTYNIFCGSAPAHQDIAIEGIGFWGTASSAAASGQLSFCNATSQGTTGTTMTPLSIDQRIGTAFQSSWIYQPTGAPSGIAVIDGRGVNPQVNSEVYFPGLLSYIMKAGGFMVVQFTPQATGNYFGWLLICE